MKSSLVRKTLLAGLALAASMGTTGCDVDNNPYGLPFEDVFSNIVGAYRPAELLNRRNPFVQGQFQPTGDGSDIRLAFGSSRTMAGRVFIPGGGPGGADLNERIAGDWTYDVPAQLLIVDMEPEIAISPPRIVFKITFLLDRVLLEADANVGGIPLALELAKPLPPQDRPESGCVNCVSFDQVSR